VKEFKNKKPTDLIAFAESLEVENASVMRKQESIVRFAPHGGHVSTLCNILKADVVAATVDVAVAPENEPARAGGRGVEAGA